MRRTLKLLEIVVCVGIIGAFTYGFFKYVERSTDFQVRNVEIHGLSYLNERDVLDASGIGMDGNILFFDSEDVQARVEAMPYVKSCRVELKFPDTVALHIVEREPYATLMLNSLSYALDEEGVVLRTYAPTEMPISPFFYRGGWNAFRPGGGGPGTGTHARGHGLVAERRRERSRRNVEGVGVGGVRDGRYSDVL